MKHLLTIVSTAGLLCSCGSVQPDGPWKDLMSGDIFSGSKPWTAEDQKTEDSKREIAHQLPPQDEEGGLNMKLRF